MIKSLKTYWVRIYMAGDIETAKQVLRKEMFRIPRCVNIHPTQYIYTGGEESGFVIELISYPRFQNENPKKILQRAFELEKILREELGQWSGLIMDSKETHWISTK